MSWTEVDGLEPARRTMVRAWCRLREPDPDMHLVLTHYLVDGHHKVRAAAEEARDITVLSLLRDKDADSTRGWWVDWVFEALAPRQA